MLLEITPECQWVHSSVWCAGVDRERVSAAIDRMHVLLRRNSRIMAVNQLAAALRQRVAFRSIADELIAGCLAADSRFKEFDGRRVGLREWEWGIPHTPEEFVIACLRVADRPLTTAGVSEGVRALVPPGREISMGAIQRILESPACLPAGDGRYSAAPRR
jgi:hypothetical protein